MENSDVRISEGDFTALLAVNPMAGTFVQDNSRGLFFANGVHSVIEHIRANADILQGYKKNIVLFPLAKTCMSGKGGFGHFSSLTDCGKRHDTPEEFKQRFSNNIARINALIFDNSRPCKGSRKDVNAAFAVAKVGLAYFDPPYVTGFPTTNYERSYRFVEELMSYWDGLTIIILFGSQLFTDLFPIQP